MRKCIPTFLVGAVLSCFSLPLAAADAEPILKANFEQRSQAEIWPEGWPQPKFASWEEEDGNRFLRLTCTEPGKMLSLYREIRIPAGTQKLKLSWRERLTGYLRGEEVWFDARIMMEFTDANRQKVSGRAPSPHIRRDTNGWQSRSIEFDVPEGAEMLKFMPTLFRVQAGTYDLDDIELRPVSP